MKTFTDTERLDFVLSHLRLRTLDATLIHEMGIGDEFSREIIDSAMRQANQLRKFQLTESLQSLRQQRTQYEQSIKSLEAELAQLA